MSYKTIILRFSNIMNKLGFRRLQRILKTVLFRMIGFLLRPGQVELPEPHLIKNIVVVKQDHQLGDMLCTTPLFSALRDNFPHAHITVIAGEKNHRVVDNHPAIDEVIIFQKLDFLSAPSEFLQFYKKIREREYDLGVVPATISTSVTSDLICRLTGAKYRLGPGKLNGEINPGNFLLNMPVELDWRGKHNHQIERNLAILRTVGLVINQHPISIGITQAAEDFAQNYLTAIVRDSDRIAGFHPGAGKQMNLWDAENFAQVADYLAAEHKFKLFISWGPDDEEVINKMTSAMKQPFVICNNQTIQQFTAVIKQMSLFLTNDTGIMHLAAATGIPVLSLFGPTDPRQWAPQGKHQRYIWAGDGKMNSISIEKVQNTLDEMISNLE